MKYLFIDTSTHDLTVAVLSNEEILGISTSHNTNEHSKYALTDLENTFKKAKLTPNDIDKVMVVNGPGSFTGIRIGVTIAKTFAWALKKDVIPVSSLLGYALGYSGYDYYVSVLDARRGYVYGAIYNSNYEVVLGEQYIIIDELNNVISSLNGDILITGDIDINDTGTSPILIDAVRIINYYKNKQAVPAHSLNPHYLKRVEAEEKMMEVIE
ncbi:MAG: tRNA (adenosine(37)-N6)-threonylcarbamoyltransferase complex dimerization subunit type 1 TsaB [Bacilli bacterium]|nr:tRNA (adenosine(37)-N6)-threonylcarbamoyltransferase complex dimerization subunit type 1 TsaB [Bacilli bacterium]MDD3305117.1 tRNA (adenosine(37)-N6)-threonylcarbamoyltransferase complex dimerization subunit type 1 TsaB [Bacilli bacterium]MDD4053350.1 tRNA (adenosine(37)-N6)-threonylcarbamoyltransferase complex dimerization subunit type 1 TsaB [Bacilli bacterium]MDD4411003.1 tRNA (adenosine(37)-N6)-threonylcarbamoyltransferase complex dimerization subunit type 1 TsaB [Bacilli bacterium]